jgi:hypothetical protein
MERYSKITRQNSAIDFGRPRLWRPDTAVTSLQNEESNFPQGEYLSKVWTWKPLPHGELIWYQLSMW